MGGWAEVLDLARDLGKGVPDGSPRTEQARLLALSVELARLADLRIFAREEPTREQVADFWSAVQAERRRLTHESGVAQRVVAVLSPRSLVHALSTRRPRGSLAGMPQLRRAG